MCDVKIFQNKPQTYQASQMYNISHYQSSLLGIPQVFWRHLTNRHSQKNSPSFILHVTNFPDPRWCAFLGVRCQGWKGQQACSLFSGPMLPAAVSAAQSSVPFQGTMCTCPGLCPSFRLCGSLRLPSGPATEALETSKH